MGTVLLRFWCDLVLALDAFGSGVELYNVASIASMKSPFALKISCKGNREASSRHTPACSVSAHRVERNANQNALKLLTVFKILEQAGLVQANQEGP